MANQRIPILLSTPAQIRFISVEPILSEVLLNKILFSDGDAVGLINALNQGVKLDWVIVGGESGNDNGQWKYRKSRLEWYYNIVLQCKKNGVPVFVKQLGTWLAKELQLSDRHGTDIDEYPDTLKVREFPKIK